MPRKRLFREAGTLATLLAVIVAAAIREPRILSASSIESVLMWAPLYIVLSVGEMAVIASGGIDVSIGTVVGFCAMAAGLIFRASPHLNVFLVTGLSVACGALVGALNGKLITWAKLPPIIATLGTMSAFRGASFILSKGAQIDSNYIPDALTNWAIRGPFNVRGVQVSWLAVLGIAAALAGYFVANHRQFGQNVLALGSNAEAARLRGLPVQRTTTMTYVLMGGLAGLGGVMYMARYGFVNPATAGQGLELSVIAAVVIGGTPVSGGSASVLGVVLGSLLIGVINVALATLGIAADWQQLGYGVVILVAVLIDAIVRGTLPRFPGIRKADAPSSGLE